MFTENEKSVEVLNRDQMSQSCNSGRHSSRGGEKRASFYGFLQSDPSWCHRTICPTHLNLNSVETKINNGTIANKTHPTQPPEINKAGGFYSAQFITTTYIHIFVSTYIKF